MNNYKEAEQIARDADKKLLASEFHPWNMVLVIHEEGTILTFRSAFLKEWKDYVLIFTEHHGTHIYHKGDLTDYGTYNLQENTKLEGMDYIDRCEFCKKEAQVEDLIYDLHPVWEKDDQQYHVYCSSCKDIEGCNYKDLWRSLNENGKWDFVWGKDDIDHIRKALATVMKEDAIDNWLDAANPAFLETPRKEIDEGDYEKVYFAVYEVGSGQFS